ncbi:MAG: zf-HC2 domain-containing protein [Blastocatellia bacterium]
MRCELFEELIPLYAGGDLEPPKADALRQHLTCCAHCRRMNEGFQASQNWLTGFTVPDFDEASFAKMRSSVLSRIEQQIEQEIAQSEKRGRWIEWLWPKWTPRMALVISAAALVAVTGLSVAVYRNQVVTPKTGGDFAGNRGATDSAPPTSDGQAITATADRVSTATGRERDSKDNRVATASRSVPPSKRSSAASELLPSEAFNNGRFQQPLEPPVIPDEPAATESAPPAEPEEKEMLRIELQTADPNIRIIWLIPKTDSPTNSKTK